MALERELNDFAAMFKQHLNKSQKATLRWVTCTAVDWDKLTMTATDANDAPYFDVQLGLGMLVVKPAADTDCLIAILENDETCAFLLYANEADLIEYNGGTNGGMCNTTELKTQLDKLTARVDGVISAIENGVVIAQDGGANFKTTVVDALEKITDKEDFSSIEDTKITH